MRHHQRYLFASLVLIQEIHSLFLNIHKIARLTEIYNQDFSLVDRSNIRDQLETFILHVRKVDAFISCNDFASLAMKLVETKRHLAFPLVYRIIELALLLPVTTASIERAFSTLNIIKTDLRNRMGNRIGYF